MTPEEISAALTRIADNLVRYVGESSSVRLSEAVAPVIDGLRHIAANSADLVSLASASRAAVGVTLHALRSYKALLGAVSRKAADVQDSLAEAERNLQAVIDALDPL